MNKKILILAAVIISLVSLWFVFQYIYAGTLNWKTYNNSEVNFNFKYPSSWIVEEELYSEVGQSFIYVSDKPINIDHLNVFDKDSKYRLTITDIGEETKENGIKAWYSEWASNIETASQKDKYGKVELPMTGLAQIKLPITGAKTNDLLEYQNEIVSSQPINTVLSVVGAGESSVKYFIVMANNRIYKVEFFPIDGYTPIRQILKTLKFK